VELRVGDYRVVKILAMGDGMVHLRLYADKWIAHLPLSAEDFATWRPGIVGHEAVREEELEGYEIWREAYAARMKRVSTR
jgi:hypothetical protein